MTNAMSNTCELCREEDGSGSEVLFRSDKLRVILVDDGNYPGFCRVIWNAHVAEMTDLPPADRSLLMRTVCQVEAALREVMQPLKINLASLGNMVPHLHWHVIPRYADDAHFPAPIWASQEREIAAGVLAQRRDLLPALRLAVVRHIECAA